MYWDCISTIYYHFIIASQHHPHSSPKYMTECIDCTHVTHRVLLLKSKHPDLRPIKDKWHHRFLHYWQWHVLPIIGLTQVVHQVRIRLLVWCWCIVVACCLGKVQARGVLDCWKLAEIHLQLVYWVAWVAAEIKKIFHFFKIDIWHLGKPSKIKTKI